MKFKLLMIIFFAIWSCGEQKKSKEVVTDSSPKEISKKYINIPGTKVSLIPPKDFQISNQYIGLQNISGECGINVVDMPEGNFFTNSRSFTVEGFNSRGIDVFELQHLTIHEYQAIFVVYENPPTIVNYCLIFGDNTFSAMLTGVTPNSYTDIGNEIKSSILSVAYDKNKVLDGADVAKFSINTEGTIFKHNMYSGGIFFYSTNEKGVPLAENNGSMFMVLQLPLEEGKNGSLKEIAQNMLLQYEMKGLKNISILEESEIKVDNLNAYEIISTAKNTDIQQDILLYIVSAGTIENRFIINGMSHDFPNLKNIIKEYKSVLKTFRFKK